MPVGYAILRSTSPKVSYVNNLEASILIGDLQIAQTRMRRQNVGDAFNWVSSAPRNSECSANYVNRAQK